VALLSCWGEVTTENEAEVIAANLKIHPQIRELLSVVADILDKAKVEYWIDQGTLLGAYRSGKFIARDSDADIAIRNEEHFDLLLNLLTTELPNAYGCERKGSHCKGYRIWLKDGGTFRGSYEGREIEWPLVACDAMFYSYNENDDTYIQQYEGFGVDTFLFPPNVIFPLGQVEFENRMYPCPAETERYLEIQYGYIGEGAIWDPSIDRWVKG
jgi:phosphorylcholine metabolism protein LicD